MLDLPPLGKSQLPSRVIDPERGDGSRFSNLFEQYISGHAGLSDADKHHLIRLHRESILSAERYRDHATYAETVRSMRAEIEQDIRDDARRKAIEQTLPVLLAVRDAQPADAVLARLKASVVGVLTTVFNLKDAFDRYIEEKLDEREDELGEASDHLTECWYATLRAFDEFRTARDTYLASRPADDFVAPKVGFKLTEWVMRGAAIINATEFALDHRYSRHALLSSSSPAEARTITQIVKRSLDTIASDSIKRPGPSELELWRSEFALLAEFLYIANHKFVDVEPKEEVDAPLPLLSDMGTREQRILQKLAEHGQLVSDSLAVLAKLDRSKMFKHTGPLRELGLVGNNNDRKGFYLTKRGKAVVEAAGAVGGPPNHPPSTHCD